MENDNTLFHDTSTRQIRHVTRILHRRWLKKVRRTEFFFFKFTSSNRAKVPLKLQNLEKPIKLLCYTCNSVLLGRRLLWNNSADLQKRVRRSQHIMQNIRIEVYIHYLLIVWPALENFYRHRQMIIKVIHIRLCSLLIMHVNLHVC